MFRASFNTFARGMTTQENRGDVVSLNTNVYMTETRVVVFIRMNPREFHCSRVEEDHKESTDEVYNVLMIIRRKIIKKAKLVAYPLNGISQVCFSQWNEERVVDAGPLE